jgi:hypothetical protein
MPVTTFTTRDLETPRVFILEDDPQRQQDFWADFPEAIICDTAKDFIALLEAHRLYFLGKTRPHIVLFLDHDLGGETWVNPNRVDSGMEVVRYLVKRADTLEPITIVVHSFNPPAARRMTLNLGAVGYRVWQFPFATTNFWTFIRDYKAVAQPKEKP